ncbi:MAG TPA: hypothetical protein VKU19_38660 [Bryobacteraceae bacterium]|nr:hypothetical protein [Bryobacteraceae bacterium]
MIVAIHKGVEIEMTLRQLPDGQWTGDFVIDPKGSREVFMPEGLAFATRELAKETGLNEARAHIDRTR